MTNSALPVPGIDPVADLLGSGQKVVFDPNLARAVGSINAAIFLAQLWFWYNRWSRSGRDYKNRWEDGWYAWSQEEITDQTALTRRECETARKMLRGLGVIEEVKRGLPLRVWYRLNKDRLYDLLREVAEGRRGDNHLGGIRQDERQAVSLPAPERRDDMTESRQLSCTKAPVHFGGKRQITQQERARKETNSKLETSATDQPQVDPSPSSDDVEPVVVEDLETSPDAQLLAALTREMGSESTARTLITTFGSERCLKQLNNLPFYCLREEQTGRRIRSRAGFLRRAIEHEWVADPELIAEWENTQRVRLARAASEQRREKTRREAKALQEAQEKKCRERREHIDAIFASLPASEQTEIEQQVWKMAYEEANGFLRFQISQARNSMDPPNRLVSGILQTVRDRLIDTRCGAVS